MSVIWIIVIGFFPEMPNIVENFDLSLSWNKASCKKYILDIFPNIISFKLLGNEFDKFILHFFCSALKWEYNGIWVVHPFIISLSIFPLGYKRRRTFHGKEKSLFRLQNV